MRKVIEGERIHPLEAKTKEVFDLRKVGELIFPGSARVVMKLLHPDALPLSPEELVFLRKYTKRDPQKIADGLCELAEAVAARKSKLRELEHAVAVVDQHIADYQRRIVRLTEDLSRVSLSSCFAQTLQDQIALCERNIEKRGKQRLTLDSLTKTCKLTTPYKDIAEFLGEPVGSVGSIIARFRRKMRELIEEERS
ncbi:MAG: hypothetical protein AAB691_04285 [Patescibacteria group bacterium]